MRKKAFLLITELIICLGILFCSQMRNKNDLKKNNVENKNNSIAIMIKENGATDYTLSSSSSIPIGKYKLNEEKTICENGGKISDYNSKMGKIKMSLLGSDKCYLYFDYFVLKRVGYQAVLLDNSNSSTTVSDAKNYIEEKTISSPPNFANVATTNEGMYSASDDLGTSYYFRGAVDNNWVKFGQNSSGQDIYWRIIRINGDSSIRMIYSGTVAPTNETAVVMTGSGTNASTVSYEFNIKYDSPSHVGYMYTAGQQHGNTESSTIKTFLDSWYVNSTKLSSETKIVDQIFCNDRSASKSTAGPSGELGEDMSTTTRYFYGAYIRLITNKDPDLSCKASSDKFTMSASNGNGVLDYPVGLITADEIVMAGGVYATSNTNYYLYTNQYYWSGSPYNNSINDCYAYAFLVYPNGTLMNRNVSHSYHVRPVISISSDVIFTGTGTWDDPYEVVY